MRGLELAHVIATPSLPAALSLVQSGKLRAVAAMGPERLSALPEVPTIAELGHPKATVLGWIGLHTPAGTPPGILGILETASSKAMQSPDLRERLTTQGADIALLSGATYGKFVTDETARWSQVVQAAGIQPQ